MIERPQGNERQMKANSTLQFSPRANSDSIRPPLYKEQAVKTEMTVVWFFFFFFSRKAGLNLRQNINGKTLNISLPIPVGI